MNKLTIKFIFTEKDIIFIFCIFSVEHRKDAKNDAKKQNKESRTEKV